MAEKCEGCGYNFGLAITYFRVKADWTPSHLAKVSGIGKNSISYHESGKRLKMQPATLAKYAKAFCISLDTFFLIAKLAHKTGSVGLKELDLLGCQPDETAAPNKPARGFSGDGVASRKDQ